jgi:hypothetical protein
LTNAPNSDWLASLNLDQEIREGVAKRLQDKPPGQGGGIIAPVGPIGPRRQDQKGNPQSINRQGPTQTKRAMPLISLPPTGIRQQADHSDEPAIARNARPFVGIPVPTPPPPFILREYTHVHDRNISGTRPDLADVLFWNPVLVLPDGTAEITFDLTDAATTYQVLVAGHTLDGRIAETTTVLTARQPSK